jgi:hypothetical protein
MFTTPSPHTSQQPPRSRGILLIALGAPQYGNMAANLAASIRIKDPAVPIHLVHTQPSISHLAPAHLALFTSRVECPAEYYTAPQPPKGALIQAPQPPKGALIQTASDILANGIVPFPLEKVRVGLDFIKAKTHLYDLTPYEETLFLDVDMMAIPVRPISEAIAQLSSVCDFTIKNRGYANPKPGYTHWFDVDKARKHYRKPNARFYQTQSEFVFFKKTKKNKLFFDKVREVFDRPQVACSDFRGGVPDEYAYNIAMALTGTYPHADHYIPVYWPFLEGRKDWNKIVIRDYIGFSIGGEVIPGWIEQKIRAYKDHFRRALKLPYLFNVPSKKRWAKTA